MSGDASSLGTDVPVVLWQYNDVVCASSAARRLAVVKHMTPEEARAIVEPVGGRLIHAFCAPPVSSEALSCVMHR